MSPADVKKRFKELGWEIVPGGDHYYAKKGKKKVKLPNEHGENASVELLSKIIGPRQSGIGRDTWLNG